MSNTVSQPSINPTRKLSAAVIATAVLELLRVGLGHFLPGTFDPAFWAAMSPVFIFAVGWFVKDEPNVVVVSEQPNQEPANEAT
jgi:hypothetical protein